MSTDSVQRDAATDEAIAGLVAGLDLAWNAHDAAAFARLFAEDADFTNVRGMQARGRDGVERFMAPLFGTMFAGSVQQVLRSTTRYLTDGLAAVDVWWAMVGARMLDGQPRPKRYGLINLVLRRGPEGWRILVWHNTEYAARPADDPTAWRFVIFHNDGPAVGAPGPASG